MVTSKQLSNLHPAKKGEVRNPKGKPKGTKHVSTWINKLLHDEKFVTQVREGYKITEYKGMPMKAILMAQIHLAVQGDSKATDLLFKYGYGTKQEIEHSGGIETQPPDPVKAAKFAEWLKQETKESLDK